MISIKSSRLLAISKPLAVATMVFDFLADHQEKYALIISYVVFILAWFLIVFIFLKKSIRERSCRIDFGLYLSVLTSLFYYFLQNPSSIHHGISLFEEYNEYLQLINNLSEKY